MITMPDTNAAFSSCLSFLKDRLLDPETTEDLESIGECYLKHFEYLKDLMSKAVFSAESNSALVIGPPGSGKTRLVNEAFCSLNNDSNFVSNSVTIWLDGLIHSDDRLALKAITNKLNLENELESKAFRNIAEALAFLLEAFEEGNKETSRTLIIVIERFDMFCSHKNQSLLYNFFDVSQAAKTPVLIIGLTCNLDVMDLLEKRVKSRFSHRQLFLLSDISFSQYHSFFSNLLTLPQSFQPTQFRNEWNLKVSNLSEDGQVIDKLKLLYYNRKELGFLKQVLLMCLCKNDLTVTEIVRTVDEIMGDSVTRLLQGLSILHITLLIAMKHLDQIYDGDPFNFEMVYREYQKFIRRKASVEGFEKAVVMKAFEELISLELIQGAGGSLKEYRLYHLNITHQQIHNTINNHYNIPTEIKMWAQCSLE